MCGNGNGIAIALEVEEKSRICGRHVGPFYDLGLCDELLELCNRKAIKLALLLLGQRLLLCLVFGICLASHFIVRVNNLALGWVFGFYLKIIKMGRKVMYS
jgi:hypothetical protein